MRPSSWFVIPLIACSAFGAQSLSKSDIREVTKAVAAVLDDWHLAAAQSEETRYFSHMAPEAVFVGILEDERWSKAEFKKWAHPGFEARQIWNFKATQRHITLSPSGEVAWFDELLETTSIGTASGTGVLVKDGTTWLITHYTLSLPIPRESFAEVTQMIYALKHPPASEKPEKSRPDK